MTTTDLSKHAPWAKPLPGDWHEAIEEYIAHRRSAGQPDTSLKAYRNDLQHLGRRVSAAPFSLTPDELSGYVGAQTWVPSTRRRRRQTVKNFYRWAKRTGRVKRSPVNEGSMPKVRSVSAHARPMPDAVYYAALAAAPPRERLMLRLGGELGMRRGEIARVSASDIREQYDGGYALVVHGKGSKDRLMPLEDDLAAAVLAEGPGHIFPGEVSGHLSPEWCGKLLVAVIPSGYSAHNLRHRFATRAHNLTHDIVLVQMMMGHSNVSTTQTYIEPDLSAMRSVIHTLARHPRMAS